MPKIVPMPIFLRQAALHTLKSVLTWVRWNMVIFVWLGWVPWCMRTVWRALFWIGDGGWVNLEDLQAQSSKTGQEHLSALAADGTLTMTDLIIHKNLTASQIIAKVTNGMPRIWWSSSQSTNSTSQPAVFRFAKSLFEIIFHRPVNGVSGDSFNSHNNTTNSSWSGTASSSLLSDVGFLRTLTPWPVMNKLIIDVLEGQLITLLVVVAFILIFLIREWVVQQQPALNMGEARDVLNRFDVEMNDAFNRAAVADGQQAEDPGLPIADQPPAPGPQANRVDDRRFAIPRARGGRPRRAGPVREEWQRYIREQQDLDIQEDIAQPAEDGTPITDGFEEDPPTNQATSPRLALSRHSSAGLSTPHSRPGLPSRDGLSRATEIQRNLEESPGWPGLDVFKDLWTRADGNPSEVLKIIQEEGREAELEWVVTAMKRFEQQVRTSTFDEIPEALSSSIRSNEGSTPGNEYPEQVRNSLYEREQDTHDLSEINVETAPVASEGISTGLVNVRKECRTGIQTGILDSNTLIDEESGQAAQNGRSGTIDSQPALQHSTETNIPESNERTPEAKPSVSEGKDDQSESQDSTSAATAIILTPTSDSLSEEGANTQEHSSPAENEALVHALPTVNNEESFQETVFNWLWGDALQQGHQHEYADEGIAEGDVDEEPLIPVVEDEPATPNDDPLEDDVVPDAQIAEAAAEVGADPNDAEAVEDGEDLEGVMELIGMQGPIAGLLQNGMFCAVLISVTVFCGVWMPYIAGKVLLVLLANPISLFVKLPLRWASTIADIIIDTSILIGGCVVYWIDSLLRFAATPVGWILPFFATINNNKVLTNAAWSQANTAGDRLLKMFVATSESFSDSDIPVFSIIAHESLTRAERFVADFASGIMTLGSVVFNGQGVNKLDWSYYVWYDSAQFLLTSIFYIVYSAALWVRRIWYMLPALLTVNPLRITLDIPHRIEPLDYSLAIWSTRDRVLTIILGYIAFALIGTSYIKICVALQENNHSQRARGVVADVLYQAAGVLKVVLIISIEMLVFPLYCGMLLDAALLPLFENATAASRINFTLTSPLTSLFVHWFVGTCYMFHFALFVSMCRKIMRNGVLCRFISANMLDTY
jgi:E3 ubiquitin-protein ligase MARCH6